MVKYHSSSSVSLILETKICNNAILKDFSVNNLGPINYNLSDHYDEIEPKNYY